MIWITTERKPCNCQAIDRLGSVYQIENEYMGYRGTLEEYTKDQMTATTVFDLNNRFGSRWNEGINIPNGGYIQVFADGEPLHVLSGIVLAHSQALDVIHNIHFRRTVFSIKGGGMVLVRSRRFASITLPHLLCLEYVIQASQACALDVRTGIDGDVWDLNGPHLEKYHTYSQAIMLSLTAQTLVQRVPVAVSEITLLPGGERACIQDEKRILQEIAVRAGAYQTVTITKFAAIYTGVDTIDPLSESKNLCYQAMEMGFAELHRKQCALWDKRWRENGQLGYHIRKSKYTCDLPDSLDSC